MTSRRRIPSGSERQSRLDQFRPGHVGGRVASAQPIRRNGGTLRRVSVGAIEIPVPESPPEVATFSSEVYEYGDTPGFTEIDAGLTLAGAVAGDTAIAWAMCFGSSVTAPSGWTTLASGGPIGPGTGADYGFHYCLAAHESVLSTTPAMFDLPGFTPGWSWPAGATSGTEKFGHTVVRTLLMRNTRPGYSLIAGTPATLGVGSSYVLPDPDVAWADGLTSILAAVEPLSAGGAFIDVGSPEWVSGPGWGWWGWGDTAMAVVGCTSPGIALPATVTAYLKSSNYWPVAGSYAGVPLPMPPSEGSYVDCDAVGIALGWVPD